jgi:type III secretion protein Q
MPSSPIIRLRPLAVASVGRAEAELARQLGLGRQAALPALAPDASLTLQAAVEAAPSWLDPLTLEGSYGRIELVRGARLLRALTGIDLGEHLHGPHSDWLQGALCARLAATPLAGTASLAASPPAGLAAAPTTLRLTLRGAGHQISTHARASAADWLRLLAGPGWLRLQAAQDAHASLALRLPVRLARHRLPHAMLASLRPGDLLRPDSGAFDCAGLGRIDLGGLRASVRYQAPATLIILALENSLENSMDRSHDNGVENEQNRSKEQYCSKEQDRNNDRDRAQEQPDHERREAQAQAPALAAGALDQLAATLDIELGQLKLTLGALRSLAVGSTLQLAGANPGALAIRCGGQLLGRAEAVDIDGALGVRITEWSAA